MIVPCVSFPRSYKKLDRETKTELRKEFYKTKLELQKERDKEVLRNGLSDPVFLDGFVAFMRGTALTDAEVAQEIRDLAGSKTATSTVTRWAGSGMSKNMKRALLAKAAGTSSANPQTKPSIQQPRDRFELEADKVADRVAGGNTTLLPMPGITRLPRANRPMRSEATGTSSSTPQWQEAIKGRGRSGAPLAGCGQGRRRGRAASTAATAG